MIVSRQAVVRLALLIIFAVIVQDAAVSQISIFGATADLGPLLVASLGLLGGAEFGAIVGFSVGLFVDLALLQTLGINSLLYLTIGYGAGRYRELRDPTATLVPPVAGAVATFIATAGYAVIQFFLGVDSPVSVLVIREIFLTTAINTLLAVPVFMGVKRWLRPYLDGPRRRSVSRRRVRAAIYS